MLVSIVIPAYNSLKELKVALHSCFYQSYKDIEVIVVDDHSTEDLSEIQNDFDLKYIRNDKNLGPAGSRNVGIKNSSGDIISFLDADDIMTKEKLSLSVPYLASKEYGMTCGNYKILKNRISLSTPFYKRNINLSYEKMLKINWVACGSVSVRRDVLDDVGLFNEKYWIAEDYDLWLRIMEKYKAKYIHQILYYYSVIEKGGSLTQRDDIQSKYSKYVDEIIDSSKKRFYKI